MQFFSFGLAKKITEALERGEWWAILFVVAGALGLLFILSYPLFFMKFF
ncbi:MAG: hypothetical protein PHN59_03510 [Candidatus Omnitrophica bacterium]|nr:hypothetical protein [Candidatus Omnitrophota bacterium]